MQDTPDWTLAPADTPANARVCPRCSYKRRPTDEAPAWQCPRCDMAYEERPAPAKVEREQTHERTARVELRSNSRRRELPWTWIMLAGIVLLLGGVLVWKNQSDQRRAAERAARAQADAQAAQVAQAREDLEEQTRVNQLAHQYRSGNYEQVLPAVRKLAEEGDLRAQVLLGMMLRVGSRDNNVPAQPEEGMGWMRRAANAGSALAMVHLGDIHERGHDAPRQASLAESWYQRAARQGDGAGLMALGLLYARGGDGLAPRPAQAYMVLQIATRTLSATPANDSLLPRTYASYSGASELRQLAKSLSTAEMAEAQRAADAWRPGQSLER